MLSGELFSVNTSLLLNGLHRAIGQIQLFMSYYNILTKKEIGQIVQNIFKVQNLH